MSTLQRSEEDVWPLSGLARALAIAAAGSALIMGTVATHAIGRFGQEPTPWVSVHHRACGAYEVAVSTRVGTFHLRLAA